MDEQVYSLQYRVEKEHWWYTARTRILLRYLEYRLGGRRDVTVLDIGCGTGALFEALAARYRATGLEPSAQAVAFCRARGLDAVHQGTPESFTPGGLFDVVTMFDVLEHIQDDRGALARVRDVCAGIESARRGDADVSRLPDQPVDVVRNGFVVEETTHDPPEPEVHVVVDFLLACPEASAAQQMFDEMFTVADGLPSGVWIGTLLHRGALSRAS